MSEATPEIDAATMAAVQQALEGQKKPAVQELEIVTHIHNGISYQVRRDAIEDIEILEWIEDEKLISVVRRILGADQWAQFKDSCRDEDSGRVAPDEFEAFITGLFERLNAGKA